MKLDLALKESTIITSLYASTSQNSLGERRLRLLQEHVRDCRNLGLGDTARALEWLETAMHHRDPYIEKLKTNPLLDRLRKEPRL